MKFVRNLRRFLYITNLPLYYAFTYIVQCEYHEKRLVSVLPIQISVANVRNKGIFRAKIEKNTSGTKDSGQNLAGQLVCRLKIWPQVLPEVTLPPESFPPIRYYKSHCRRRSRVKCKFFNRVVIFTPLN